ncbi:MAG: hypothetical protein AAFR63_12585 [Cyanobacteria bacterium J06631_6]
MLAGHAFYFLPVARSKSDRGMPHSLFRYVLNTLLYMLITGCRWCNVLKGKTGHQKVQPIDS